MILLLTFSGAPSAIGTWSVKGAVEPDTPYDLDGVTMRLLPDTDPNPGLHTVYFNGFGAFSGAVSTTLNPNFATLGTSVQPAPFVPVALFGIWKDCNADGFVGNGDNGAFEYLSATSLRADICPVRAPDPDNPWDVHNDGTWVIEFIPIGYDDITTARDENPININDTQARVWADWGLPGDAPGLSCPMFPAPYGSFRSTGGLLRWADCNTSFRIAQSFNDAATLAGQPQLGFSDAPRDRPDASTSPLNTPNPWGSEADTPMVRALDCRASSDFPIADPTSGSLGIVSDDEGNIIVLQVHPLDAALDLGGSPAGTVNESEAVVTDCDRTNRGEVLDTDGQARGSDGDLPYLAEGGSEASTPFAPRTRTDHVLAFEEGTRGGDPLSMLLGPRTRESAGLGLATLTGFWVGTGSSVFGHNTFASRESLGPEKVTYITYYASLSTTTILNENLRLPGETATGPYASLSCGPTIDCDAANWWKDSAGNDIVPRDSRLGSDPADPTVPRQDPRTEIGVRIGQRYNMRDIDCIDTSFDAARSNNVTWGTLTGTTCA